MLPFLRWESRVLEGLSGSKEIKPLRSSGLLIRGCRGVTNWTEDWVNSVGDGGMPTLDPL